MPIITRIFTPDEFGLLALYTSILYVLSSVVSLKYENAIIQAKSDKSAMALVNLIFFLTIGFDLLFFVIIFLFDEKISGFFNMPNIANWLYLLPISLFFTSLYNALNYYTIRKKQFKSLAYANISRSISSRIFQLFFGFLKTHGGLIMGQIFGNIFAFLSLFLKNKQDIRFVDFRLCLLNAKKYSVYPKYAIIGSISNNLSAQIPIFIISKAFFENVLGYFSLLSRVLNMPSGILSSAISNVLFQKINEMKSKAPEKVMQFILKIAFILFCLILPFVLIIHFHGENIFIFVFGKAWATAGKYAQIVIFAICVKFIVSPLSCVLNLKDNVKYGVFWQICYLFCICLVLIISARFEIEIFIYAYTICEIVLYLFYFALILKACQIRHFKEKS